MCRLTDEEIDAIAEHEDLSTKTALEMGHYFCKTINSELRLNRIIADDIEAATERGDFAHAAKLRRFIQYFLEHHAGVLLHDDQKAPKGQA
ncbi:MAG: hypothetical protein OEU92_25340 [Alphaproteobacteria bacterium]|nr:hypothetical protein [Alphaproteobacteria bacterium]